MGKLFCLERSGPFEYMNMSNLTNMSDIFRSPMFHSMDWFKGEKKHRKPLVYDSVYDGIWVFR